VRCVRPTSCDSPAGQEVGHGQSISLSNLPTGEAGGAPFFVGPVSEIRWLRCGSGFEARTPKPNSVKVDITIEEVIVLPLEQRPVLRAYDEFEDLPNNRTLTVYSA
jgi:hypothetical protein